MPDLHPPLYIVYPGGGFRRFDLSPVLLDIADERSRQDAQWGGAQHDDRHNHSEWANLVEKSLRAADGEASDPVAPAPQVENKLRRKLVQAAALIVAEIESIDRRPQTIDDHRQTIVAAARRLTAARTDSERVSAQKELRQSIVAHDEFVEASVRARVVQP